MLKLDYEKKYWGVTFLYFDHEIVTKEIPWKEFHVCRGCEQIYLKLEGILNSLS